MREDLFGYVLDVLDADEQAAVEQALKTDGSLQREFDATRALGDIDPL